MPRTQQYLKGLSERLARARGDEGERARLVIDLHETAKRYLTSHLIKQELRLSDEELQDLEQDLAIHVAKYVDSPKVTARQLKNRIYHAAEDTVSNFKIERQVEQTLRRRLREAQNPPQDLDEAVSRAQVRERVRQAIKGLPSRQKGVVTQLFGIGVEPKTPIEIGMVQDVSDKMIHGIKKRALDKLRRKPELKRAYENA